MSGKVDDPVAALAKFRGLFPITNECIYFNHAGTGPISLPARRAIEHCTDVYAKNAEFETDDYFRLIREARGTVAHLVNARPEEIVLTHNTSEGIYIALANLPLQEGDAVIVMDEVFPAVRYVVDHNLPGIEKRYVCFAGRDPVEVVRANVTGRVKAVIIDYVQFLSGETVALEYLSEYTWRHGIFLVVDGIQGIGAMEFDAAKAGVDFLACGSAKWLFGPSGAGFLYVNRRNLGVLGTRHTGWLGAGWSGFENIAALPALYPDARRFEMGTRNIIGILAFSENINILLQYGINNVQTRIGALKTSLRQFFEDYGFVILTPAQGVQSGIITVRPQGPASPLYRYLRESGVILSLRNECLRFSPHFYNSEEEVEQMISLIRSF
jgi:cysteine desulfurase/selenocysteine lyase